MKQLMKKNITLSLFFISIMNISFGACETLDCSIEGLLPHMTATEDLMSTIAYIVGVIFVYKSIIKFKENNESKGQVKLTWAILYFVAGGLLLGLPSVVKSGRETISVKGTYDKNTNTY